MTDLNLDAIRARVEKLRVFAEMVIFPDIALTIQDLTDLIAEVERLRELISHEEGARSATDDDARDYLALHSEAKARAEAAEKELAELQTVTIPHDVQDGDIVVLRQVSANDVHNAAIEECATLADGYKPKIYDPDDIVVVSHPDLAIAMRELKK